MKALQRAHDESRRIAKSDIPTFDAPEDDDEEEEELSDYDEDVEESSSEDGGDDERVGANGGSAVTKKRRGGAVASGGSSSGTVGKALKKKRMSIPAAERRVLVFAFPFPLISGTFGLHLVCNARGFEGGQSFCRVHSCTAAADRR
jgi:hypothetical protein